MSLQILEREREEWHKFCVGAPILYYLNWTQIGQSGLDLGGTHPSNITPYMKSVTACCLNTINCVIDVNTR